MSNNLNNLRFVNFSQLRSFYAVAREGSITKAALLLNIGQPTVTTQVKGLEDTYNVQLFNRSPRLVSLTPEGEMLYEIARQVFSLEERAVELLSSHEAKVTGMLRIGTVGPHFVMDILARIHRDYPLMQVYIESGNSEQIYGKLLDYEVDVAVTGSKSTDPRIAQIQLGTHEIVLMVHSDHPWAHRDSVSINECDGQRLVLREKGSMTRQVFEQTMDAAGVRANVVMEVARDTMHEAIRSGFGIGVVSLDERGSDPALRYISFSDVSPSTESYASCMKERANVRGVKLFMDIIGELTP